MPQITTLQDLLDHKILNPDLRMSDLAAAHAQLVGPPRDGSPIAAWELVGRDFVLRGLPQDIGQMVEQGGGN